MSSLLDDLERDIADVFLNLDEFAEVHDIDRQPVACVVSTNEALPIPGGYAFGVASSGIVLYVAEGDLERKMPGQGLIVDGRNYVIDSWALDMGMYRISLSSTGGI